MSAGSLTSPQRAFACALLGADRSCPPGLRAWNGSNPAARFGVHRNNLRMSLVEALADNFPVVRALVGDAFFDAMARIHVMRALPRSPVLALYGDRFPAFIEGFKPASCLPYLADVARLEWLRVRAFHAADAPALARDEIAQQLRHGSRIADARVRLHPSAAALGSRFAVVAVWAAHQGHGDLADVDPWRPQGALVLRNGQGVEVIAMPRGAATFVRRLADGSALHVAASAASACDDGFDLAASLALLIRRGALGAWLPCERGDHP
jgi:hypothetical protein